MERAATDKLDRFLSVGDAERVRKTLHRLYRHKTQAWTLVGGLATEIHCIHGGLVVNEHALNDIDFVVPSFDCIPDTVAQDSYSDTYTRLIHLERRFCSL